MSRTRPAEPVPTRAISDIYELRQADFRLSPPPCEIEGVQWHVFEGRRWITSVLNRSQHIKDVEGWGAPLVLRTGPYNSCQAEQPLLQALTNQGEIREVEFGPEAARHKVKECVASSSTQRMPS